MFEKLKVKRKIRKLKMQIEMLEKKRERSQAELINAILTNTEPADADVDYFNRYTARIEENRVKIKELQESIRKE